MKISASRGLAARLMALAAVVTLPVACSSNSDDTASGSGDSDWTTVTIDGAFGDAVIEEQPERVLALSETDADILASIGVDTIAYPDPGLDVPAGYPWEQGHFPADIEAIAVTDDNDEVNFEAIAALDPDLLVATTFYGLDEDVYAKLSAIAPVVHYTEEANSDSWQDSTRRIGEAVGRTAEADEAIAETEAAVAQVKSQNPQLEGKTFNAVVSPSAEGLWVLCSNDDNMARVLTSLGMTLSDYAQTVDCNWGKGQISWEEASKLDADMLWVVPNTADTSVFDTNPVWTALPVVQRGSVVITPSEDGTPRAAAFPSPISLKWVIEEYGPQFSAAVDKGADAQP
ncbi:iron-siderophore ABC transporter substrate-binding protein [Rhodococcus sp. CX]|uniref:iron-siderophore ABC transporter substrate-binding protein n=1 Tax=Rhodococcus sp. CX TaxID=2789880 RepID=UPI0018CD661C|nr:iron-siderophore ABC transporter substrate-binding protein [Rhodococcus sp. CX]MBH0122315.1 iron-siderophore ABC transporter substrate-binding protein [Rhodococcus sp. CX]